MKCKYMFMFPLKHLARKGLIKTDLCYHTKNQIVLDRCTLTTYILNVCAIVTFFHKCISCLLCCKIWCPRICAPKYVSKAQYPVCWMKMVQVDNHLSSNIPCCVGLCAIACSSVNTLRPGHNGPYFADHILKCLFSIKYIAYWFNFYWNESNG